jgi:uncharacterized protein (DUF1501 family)
MREAFQIQAEPEKTHDRYGRNAFGYRCLAARRLIERGVRLVTVNMFDSVFNQVTWDCHANGYDLKSTLRDYKGMLCPMFDTAYTALLDDLKERGLLDSTLVVALGEIGRTPKLNRHGGRDHWPRVWSILMAGGGVQGGQVIGRSDRHGAEPADRPLHAAEIAATVCHALDIRVKLTNGLKGKSIEAKPVLELF